MAGQLLCDCMGLPLTCASEEALELHNKALLAYVSLRESLVPYASKALELDPTLILEHCMLGNYGLSNLQPPTGPNVATHLEAVKSVDASTLTERERGHIKAFLTNCSGNLHQAVDEWAEILVDCPLDVLAIRLVHTSCVTTGEFVKMRDYLARVLPHWKEESPYFPHILGYYAFGLEENKCRDLAEELARKALSMEPRAPWATHTMSHVLEEAHDAKDGVEFLTSTRKDWGDSLFAGHITWHLALYYYDLGDTDSALREYDTVLAEEAVPDNYIGILDATSLLWRLDLMGIDTGDRWQQVTDSCSVLIGKSALAWVDAHLMMSLAHGKATESAARLALGEQLIKAMKEFAESNVSTHCKITDTLGVPVCNALLAYGKEKYDEVVSLMLPLRYDFWQFGGSWAQRQVFNVTLIHAAIKANQHSLALALVAELKAQKPKNRQLSKLFEQLKTVFDHQQKSLEPAAKKTRLDCEK